ncbi:MAG: hypothetical protein ACKO2N_01795, partial [Tabrizicola sp.]
IARRLVEAFERPRATDDEHTLKIHVSGTMFEAANGGLFHMLLGPTAQELAARYAPGGDRHSGAVASAEPQAPRTHRPSKATGAAT